MVRLSLMSLMCCSLSGCLRPKESVVYIVSQPGAPAQILESNKKTTIPVKMQDLESGKIVDSQEIQGWVAMPKSHWDVIKGILEKYSKEHK